MNAIFNENINEIIDDEFMTKDVSELVKGDYYLFHVEQCDDYFKSYFWKDGVVFCGNSDDSLLITNKYTKGTLQDFVDKLYDSEVSND